MSAIFISPASGAFAGAAAWLLAMAGGAPPGAPLLAGDSLADFEQPAATGRTSTRTQNKNDDFTDTSIQE
jgi:hypothetical protein